MKRKNKYTADLPRRLYSYFHTYSEASSAPSFTKFARSIGITLDDLKGFRTHKKFERAYRECNEIRRDYLIDMALTKRFDSSLVKFLLVAEFGMGEESDVTDDKNLTVSLKVLADPRDEN